MKRPTGMVGVVVGMLLFATVLPCAKASSSTSSSSSVLPSTSMSEGGDPIKLRRLVQRFDFEEWKLGNFELLPGYWHRIGQPSRQRASYFLRQPWHRKLVAMRGFPSYTQVRFDPLQTVRGNHSLYMGLNGGNAGAFLEIGAVPAVPHSDYRITARIRTRHLKHARLLLTAYFVDGRGQRIEESVVRSKRLRSFGAWQQVSLRLNGDFPRAAWIGMQTELRQQEYDPSSPLGKNQILFNDVQGSAWVDDIAIWQLPSVSVTTQSPTNLIRYPDRPRLDVTVRDMTGHRLISELTLYDAHMRQVAKKIHPVGAGASAEWRWSPPLRDFGWYLTNLEVRETHASDGEAPRTAVARALGAFIWLPGEPTRVLSDARHFGIDAQGISAGGLTLLPEVMRLSDLHRVTLSAWHKDTSLKNLESQQNTLDGVLHQLLSDQNQVTLSLSPVPVVLGSEIDEGDLTTLRVLGHDQSRWTPLVKPVLLRHSQRVRRWQLGSSSRPEGFFIKNLPDLLTRVRYRFESWLPRPNLLLPWSIQQPRNAELASLVSYVLAVPYGVQPQYLPNYLKEWSGSDYVLSFQEPDATQLDQSRRVADLVLRMLYAWSSSVSGQMLKKPWVLSRQRKLSLLPDPLLGAFASVSHRLAGRRWVGNLRLGRGLECMVFGGKAGGMLAVWNRFAPRNKTTQHLYLGAGDLFQVDVWGNRSPVGRVGGLHRFKVTREPTFIENIDLKLAQFRGSFKVDQPFIASSQTPHARTLLLRNPWSRTITGRLTVTGPARWRIEPKRTVFSIAAGRLYKIPVSMSFPVSETAGHKQLAVHLVFNTGHSYDVTFKTPLELGLKDIDFHSSLTFERNAKTGKLDAVVTQQIANRGENKLSLYAFANMTGYSRQERLVSRLLPGQSIVRRFRFPGAAPLLRTRKIRTGLRQTQGPVVINHLLSVEDVLGE